MIVVSVCSSLGAMRLGSVLLMLSHRRFPLPHLDFHRLEHLLCLCVLVVWLTQSHHRPLLHRVSVLHLLNVQTVASKMIRLCINCLSPSSFLCVQLLSRWGGSLVKNLVWLRNERVSGRIVAEVGLIHKLLIEARCNWHIVACRPRRTCFLKQFSNNQFLLVLHATHALALDSSAKIIRATY